MSMLHPSPYPHQGHPKLLSTSLMARNMLAVGRSRLPWWVCFLCCCQAVATTLAYVYGPGRRAEGLGLSHAATTFSVSLYKDLCMPFPARNASGAPHPQPVLLIYLPFPALDPGAPQ
jgi:hypothetical protein